MKRLQLPGAMLGLTVLLTACPGGPGTPDDGANGLNPARLTGQVSGWTFGRAGAGLFEYSSNTLSLLEGGTVGSSGAVDIALPQAPGETFSLLGGCTFDGSQTVAEVNIQLADVVVLKSQGDVLGTLENVRTSDRAPLTRLYADRPAALNGTALCGETTLKLSLDVKAGWNVVIPESSGNTLTLTSVPISTPAELHFRRGAEQAVLEFADSSTVTLRPGQTVSREVRIYQDGGIEGELDLSTNVPGVTVTPGKLTLPTLAAQALKRTPPQTRALNALKPQALTTTLTFGLTPEATTYAGTLQIRASQDGRAVGAGTLLTDIQAPSVSVSVGGSGSPVSAYQNSTAAVPVRLLPQDGFNGSVTLTLTGLPSGVTAAPVPVQITANSTTDISVPLQVMAEAPLGTAPVRISGNNVSTMGDTNTFSLIVKPARVAVGSSVGSMAPAAQGVFVASTSYDSGSGSSWATVRRIDAGRVISEITIPTSGGGSLLPIPGGDAYLVTLNATGKHLFSRIKDDGTFATLTAPSGLGYGAVDAQGRVWFLQVTSSQIGLITYGLSRWDPATGEVAVVDASRNYGTFSDGPMFTRSNSGRYLLIRGGYGSEPMLIDTATSTAAPIPTPNQGVGQGAVVAVSDEGQVWWASYDRLTRVNADGSANTFTLPTPIWTLAGFDQKDPTVLWITTSSSVLKINSETGAVSETLATDFVTSTAVNRDGGITFLTAEHSNNVHQNYVSVVH